MEASRKAASFFTTPVMSQEIDDALQEAFAAATEAVTARIKRATTNACVRLSGAKRVASSSADDTQGEQRTAKNTQHQRAHRARQHATLVQEREGRVVAEARVKELEGRVAELEAEVVEWEDAALKAGLNKDGTIVRSDDGALQDKAGDPGYTGEGVDMDTA